MKPGDLVRVRNLGVFACHRGKVGMIVAVDRAHATHSGGRPCRYDVLLDGGIVNLYGVYLESLNEAR